MKSALYADQALALATWCEGQKLLPKGLGLLAVTVVSDGRGSSDTLLILADALHELAEYGLLTGDAAYPPRAAAIEALRQQLITLAPSRASPPPVQP